MVPICDITPFTLQDFPDHTACILWFKYCNFRCMYCYNVDIVKGSMVKKNIPEIWEFLRSRIGLLDGVVLSGGECTLYSGLRSFVANVRSLGFKIKIDTNGSNPAIIKSLCSSNLVDYIALDYKAPQYLFSKITKYHNQEPFFETLDYLCNSSTNFEVRTTVHTALLNEIDVANIIYDLDSRNYRGVYYIQCFNASKTLYPMPAQTHFLDIEALPIPQNFTIKTRNWQNVECPT